MADKRCPHGWVVVSQCPDCKKITGLQSEIDKLAMENKTLRGALEALVSISNDACIGPWEVARAALQGANHEV